MLKQNKIFIYLTIITCSVLAYVLLLRLETFMFFAALIALTIFFIYKKADNKEKKFLIALVVLIFITRVLASVIVMESRGREIGQDEGLYSKKALIKALGYKNLSDFEEYFQDADMLNKNYGWNAYTALISWFYYLFGYRVQSVRLVNIFLSILVFLIIFYTAKSLFDLRIAKISSAIYAFFPSSTLWSVMIQTDTFTIFGISLFILSMLKLLKKFNILWLIALAAGLTMVEMIKSHIAPTLLLLIGIAIVSKLFMRFSRRGKIAFAAFILITIFLYSPLLISNLMSKTEYLLMRQWWFATSDSSGYIIYPEHCYRDFTLNPSDILKGYCKGMMYVIFAPFAWHVKSKLQLMAYPQVIFWYSMFPFAVYGFYRGLKENRLATYIILSYVVISASMLAFVEGNVGALFRHRDIITPFLLIYFGAGVYKLREIWLKVYKYEYPTG